MLTFLKFITKSQKDKNSSAHAKQTRDSKIEANAQQLEKNILFEIFLNLVKTSSQINEVISTKIVRKCKCLDDYHENDICAKFTPLLIKNKI